MEKKEGFVQSETSTYVGPMVKHGRRIPFTTMVGNSKVDQIKGPCSTSMLELENKNAH